MVQTGIEDGGIGVAVMPMRGEQEPGTIRPGNL